MNEAWAAMLKSVEKRRDVDARFYKPACLLAVIDGIADGSLAPSDLDPERVVARFSDYLEGLFPERAGLGWRPFWHLSRDGAWTFTREGREVGPEDFKRQRKPNSRRELMTRIDHVSVPPETRRHWRSASARDELRAAVIDMLRRDDEACRRVARHLERGGTYFIEPPATVLNEAARSPARAFGRQGFLQSSRARKAIEQRAMALATELLESEGWEVENVATRRSYDLHCRWGSDTLFVEVKGTAGTGEEIRITAAEVAFANLHREQMLLIVVSGIVLDPADEDRATGGIIHRLDRWAPEPGALSPVSYFCQVALPPGAGRTGSAQRARPVTAPSHVPTRPSN
jgi:hypothetical protein